MKAKTALLSLVVMTFLVFAAAVYILFVPAAQSERNAFSTLFFAILEKNKIKHVDYRNYVPGDSDEERWKWLALNLENLSHASHEKIKTALPQTFKVLEAPNTFVFRITKRVDDEDAFSDKFYALRIQIGENDVVNKIEIFRVETVNSATGAF